MVAVRLSIALALLQPVSGQWAIQPSNTKASLRGIDYAGRGVAWASGSEGTILRTLDGGQSWQRCIPPPDSEKLDFRGIQALDRKTALVMSSGSGDRSRLYRTTDGCETWSLVFTNPDTPNGFFDAIQLKGRIGDLIGDPVGGRFAVFHTSDYGRTWVRKNGALAADAEALFAASNSCLLAMRGGTVFVTGGPVSRSRMADRADDIPLRHGASAGAFSVASGNRRVLVAVGGDYQKPNETAGTSATSFDGGLHWSAAEAPPHGYRSAAAFDGASHTWISVGPNGTDVSRDDGHHWSALSPLGDDPGDADKNWNALSLPFAVGSNGRIGKLRN